MNSLAVPFRSTSPQHGCVSTTNHGLTCRLSVANYAIRTAIHNVQGILVAVPPTLLCWFDDVLSLHLLSLVFLPFVCFLTVPKTPHVRRQYNPERKADLHTCYITYVSNVFPQQSTGLCKSCYPVIRAAILNVHQVWLAYLPLSSPVVITSFPWAFSLSSFFSSRAFSLSTQNTPS